MAAAPRRGRGMPVSLIAGMCVTTVILPNSEARRWRRANFSLPAAWNVKGLEIGSKSVPGPYDAVFTLDRSLTVPGPETASRGLLNAEKHLRTSKFVVVVAASSSSSSRGRVRGLIASPVALSARGGRGPAQASDAFFCAQTVGLRGSRFAPTRRRRR